MIWLARDGGASWQTAPLLHPLRVIGEMQGTALRLWRTDVFPPLRRALASDEPVTVTASLALGLRVAAPDRKAHVLVSMAVANLAELPLPASARAVRVVAHRRERAATIVALGRAVARFRGEGRAVAIVDHAGAPLPMLLAQDAGEPPAGAPVA